MTGVFNVLKCRGKSFNNRLHNGVKITGDQLSRATASRNNEAAWIVDFMNLRQGINMKDSGSGVDEVTGSLR